MKIKLLNIEKIEINQKVIQKYNKNIDFIQNFNDFKTDNIHTIYLRFSKNIDENYLKKFPNLKSIICNATGVDHIDQGFCKINKIKIFCLKNRKNFLEKNITSSAEHTWCLLMNATRNFKNHFENIQKGEWNRNVFLGEQLKDKSISIFGLGRNGKKIARFAKSFQMKVSYFDPFVDDKNVKRTISIKDALRAKDFIVICIPLNQNTRNFFNKKIMSEISKGTKIINTSRGEVVDEKSIINLLKKNIIKCYAADVVTNEIKFFESPLFANRMKYNILLSPHIGGATKEAWELTELYLFKKFAHFFKLHY